MKKLIVVCAVVMSAFAFFSTQNRVNSGKYKAEYPKITTIHDTLTVKGTVVENRRTDVYVSEGAVISEMYVKVGDRVKRGEALFFAQATNLPSSLNISSDFIQSQISSQSSYGTKSFVAPNEVVSSPSDGVVMSINSAVGDSVGIIMPVLVISDLSDVRVCTQINEENIKKVHENMAAEIKVDALSDEFISGEVDTVMPYAVKAINLISGKEQGAKTDVFLAFDSPVANISPGYSATVKLITDVRGDALVVPYEYILQDEDKEFVYVLGDNSQVEKRYIKTGYELEDFTEIVSGILKTDLLLSPYNGISQGDTVEITVKYADK